MRKFSLIQFLLSKTWVSLVIAVVISMGIWVYMSMNATNDTTVTITNLPIQTELSESAKDLGLQVFKGDEATASVTLSGNRTVLGQVNASDLIVTAAANSVSTTGNYTLPVSVTKTDPSMNFNIDNSTPSSINVVVDYFKESTFDITDGIVYYVNEGYYGSTSMPFNEVTISGPQSEIMKISKVKAVANISGQLTESVDVTAAIELYDENDNELPKKLLKLSADTINVTVIVLPEKKVPLSPVYINKPSGLELDEETVVVNPSEILLAGPKNALDNVKSVNIDAIDFATLKNEKRTINGLSIDVIDSCKNISNTSTANVTIDFSSFASKQFEVDKFEVSGLSDDYKYEVTSKSITVTVVGPKSEIESLSSDDITAVIDTSGAKGKTGSVEMPVSFKFSSTKSCWAYGKYQANLTISEK